MNTQFLELEEYIKTFDERFNIILNNPSNIFLFDNEIERLNMKKYYLSETTEFTNDFIDSYSQFVTKYDMKDTNKQWDTETNSFKLNTVFNHQKYVVNFLNKNTPYRGLLLYHGLGSGKTGASIVTADGYGKEIIVMTPASLRQNYIDEIINKFGKNYYRKLNNWVWIPFNDERFKNNVKGLNTAIRFLEKETIKTTMKSKINPYIENSDIFSDKKKKQEMITKLTLLRDNINKLLENFEQKKREFLHQRHIADIHILKYKTIRKSGNNVTEGIWMIDNSADKENFSSLSTDEQEEIEKQILSILEVRYHFINYNSGAAFLSSIFDTLLPSNELNNIKQKIGIETRLNLNAKELTKIKTFKFNKDEKQKLLEYIYEGTEIQNPFDNKVIIIDEIHNLTSLMISGGFNGQTVYELIMRAENVNLIFLSGTPVINTPYQLAITFNLLRGLINMFKFNITNSLNSELIDKLKNLLYNNKLIDRFYVSQNSKNFEISFLNYGFVNNYTDGRRDGVIKDKLIDETYLIQEIIEYLAKNQIDVRFIDKTSTTLFPDFLSKNKILNKNSLIDIKLKESSIEDFDNLYINKDTYTIKSESLVDFQKRIIGLVSHYNEISSTDPSITIFPKVIMADKELTQCFLSDYQFLIYLQNRKKEFDKEKKQKINMIIKGDSQSFSFFKVLTRQTGNFTFPPNIIRPLPSVFRKKKKENIEILKKKQEMFLYLSDICTNLEKREDKDLVLKTLCDKILEDTSETNNFRTIYTEIINKIKNITEMEDDGTQADFDCSVLEEDLKFFDQSDYNDFSDIFDIEEEKLYVNELNLAIEKLNNKNLTINDEKYNLNILSPKFIKILENINNTNGLVFCYSQFRMAEGLGVFQKILNYNGYYELDLDLIDQDDIQEQLNLNDAVRYQDINDDEWKTSQIKQIKDDTYILINNLEIEKNKCFLCKYAVWSGGTDAENRKKILNYFTRLDNNYGQKCLILLATQAGAEGISLKNVRQVHIFEPYWNNIRTDQVIGRARRYMSHQDLKESQRDVTVFSYVIEFTNDQKEKFNELLQDFTDNPDNEISADIKQIFEENKYEYPKILKNDNFLTSDQDLELISINKTKLLMNFLNLIKETSIDCNFNSVDNIRSSRNYSEINCLERVTTNKMDILDTTHTYDLEANLKDTSQVKQESFKTAPIPFNNIFLLLIIPEEFENIMDYIQSDERIMVYNYYNFYNLDKSSIKLYQMEIIGEIFLTFDGKQKIEFFNKTNYQEIQQKFKTTVNINFLQSLDYYKKLQQIINEDYPEFPPSDKPQLIKNITEIKFKYQKSIENESLLTKAIEDVDEKSKKETETVIISLDSPDIQDSLTQDESEKEPGLTDDSLEKQTLESISDESSSSSGSKSKIKKKRKKKKTWTCFVCDNENKKTDLLCTQCKEVTYEEYKNFMSLSN